MLKYCCLSLECSKTLKVSFLSESRRKFSVPSKIIIRFRHVLPSRIVKKAIGRVITYPKAEVGTPGQTRHKLASGCLIGRMEK
jgi:hypothetical protein